MEYQVPQFIEVEDKIVGPLTLRQFIYIAGAAGLCVVFVIYLPLYIAIILCIPIIALATALSFYKVNGKPFIDVLEAGFSYYTGNKLFLWRREAPKASQAAPQAAKPAPEIERPQLRGGGRLTRGKLSELAWSLDVKPVGGDTETHEA